jgi:hypothetical protein
MDGWMDGWMAPARAVLGLILDGLPALPHPAPQDFTTHYTDVTQSHVLHVAPAWRRQASEVAMFGLPAVTGPHYRRLALKMLTDDDAWDRCGALVACPAQPRGAAAMAHVMRVLCRYKGAYYAQAPSHLDTCEGHCRVEQICVLITMYKDVCDSRRRGRRGAAGRVCVC